MLRKRCGRNFDKRERYQLATCDHQYCLECWDNYLTTKLSEGFPGALVASCINPKCKTVVDICSWRKLVDEAQFLRYQWFLLKAFVDNSPKTQWCSNPQACGYAAYYSGVDLPPVLEVKCKCGFRFCFHCGEEAHQPCTCKQVATWQAMRTGEEGQNALWLSQNTKRCPNCKVHIEKNEGCMHMICKICFHEFCWLCKGNWTEHGDKTGGYYSCNRYDPLKHDTPDLDLRFGKYVHHFQRFTYHSNARKVAENRAAEIKQRDPRSESDKEPWAKAYLYDVLDLVLIGRHVLKYTYVFGFFLEEGKEKELFEFLQEDLEKSTEHLTELLFGELDSLAAPPVPTDTHNYMKVTRKFLESLIVGLQNGLTADYGPPSPEDLNAKARKKQKDKHKKKPRIGWKKDRSKQSI